MFSRVDERKGSAKNQLEYPKCAIPNFLFVYEKWLVDINPHLNDVHRRVPN